MIKKPGGSKAIVCSSSFLFLNTFLLLMTQGDKKTFIRNIFRLLIWGVLLATCFGYLKNHPAEEIALYSGFKNILQKAEILWYNLIGKNGSLLEQKYKLENNYLEMIHFAEEKGCSDKRFINELHDTYSTLLKEDKKHIENYITRYNILYNDYTNRILNECST